MEALRIAFLGHGNVGAPLAIRLSALGHRVTLATANAALDSVRKVLARAPAIEVADPEGAVRAADVVFLATPFGASESVLTPLRAALQGKLLVDCTNPVGPGLKHGLDNRQSGTEFLQALLPGTPVVKAFTIYGYENLEDPVYPGYGGLRPVMLFCGRDEAAKRTVAALIGQLGYEPLDVGGPEQALHLEHMTLLWVRLVRMQKHSPQLVWAALHRGQDGVVT